jgi:hypothetical protein
MTYSVVSVTAQKMPPTRDASLVRIGLYENVKYASSRGRWRFRWRSSSSDHVARPSRMTPSSIGPIVSQISLQHSRPERPSHCGCFPGPSTEM